MSTGLLNMDKNASCSYVTRSKAGSRYRATLIIPLFSAFFFLKLSKKLNLDMLGPVA